MLPTSARSDLVMARQVRVQELGLVQLHMLRPVLSHDNTGVLPTAAHVPRLPGEWT